MATGYTGTATYHTTVPCVDATDDDDATSIAIGEQALADRTAYLKSRSPKYFQHYGSTATAAVISGATNTTFTGATDWKFFDGSYPVAAGDDLTVRLNCHVYRTGGAGDVEYQIAYAIGSATATKVVLPGSNVRFASLSSAVPVSLEGSVWGLTQSGDLFLFLQCANTGGGTMTVSATGPYFFRWEVETCDK